jgi:hypothetical protein
MKLPMLIATSTSQGGRFQCAGWNVTAYRNAINPAETSIGDLSGIIHLKRFSLYTYI